MSFNSRHFRLNSRLEGVQLNAPVMKYGESGYPVRLVQTALIDLNYLLPISVHKHGTPDGIYGKEVKKKVYRLQVDEKLDGKDGIVGKDTITRMDEMLHAGGIGFTKPKDLPPGARGDVKDSDGNSREVILSALGAGNHLRNISSWTVEMHQVASDEHHKVTITGRNYDAIAKAVHDDEISVEVHPGISAAALYVPKNGMTGVPPGVGENTFVLSRPLRNTMNDRSMIIHEATHAICDLKGRPMNALFSEVVSFVAEGLYNRRAKSAAKSSSKAHVLADEIAQALLRHETPATKLIDDLALNIRKDPEYGPFTYGTVQYNGIG